MLWVGDNEWLQGAAGGQKTTTAALDFVILIALCGLEVQPHDTQGSNFTH